LSPEHREVAELALKSVIAAKEVEIPRTHDLRELMKTVSEDGIELPDDLAAAQWLTAWAVEFRYEAESANLDVDAGLEAATTAIALAEEALEG
jgi:HEPN domain-containing protein